MKSKIGHITTWGVQCGIARHLRYWLEQAGHRAIVLAEHVHAWQTVQEEWNTFPSVRCWTRGAADYSYLIHEIERLKCRIVHMQWDPTFFPMATLEALSAWLKEKNIPLVATLHVLIDIEDVAWENKAILRCADVVVAGTPDMVKTVTDYAARYAIPLRRPVHEIPLSAPRVPTGAVSKLSPGPALMTWGFFGARKGCLEVAEAVLQLRAAGWSHMRHIVAGLAMTEEQRQAVAQLQAFSDAHPGVLEIREGFLSDDEVYALCRSAHVVVLNHQVTHQSSSGTVALSVASGTPVVVSDSPMFSGYEGAVVVASPGVAGMARAIVQALLAPDVITEGRKRVLARTNAKAVAAEYERVYEEVTA